MASEERFPRTEGFAYTHRASERPLKVWHTRAFRPDQAPERPVVILDARDYADLRRAADVLARWTAHPRMDDIYSAAWRDWDGESGPDMVRALEAALAAADAATEDTGNG